MPLSAHVYHTTTYHRLRNITQNSAPSSHDTLRPKSREKSHGSTCPLSSPLRAATHKRIEYSNSSSQLNMLTAVSLVPPGRRRRRKRRRQQPVEPFFLFQGKQESRVFFSASTHHPGSRRKVMVSISRDRPSSMSSPPIVCFCAVRSSQTSNRAARLDDR